MGSGSQSERSHRRPGIGAGALAGALAAGPLSVFLYLGHRLWAAPFAPYALFEWVASALPGAVITRGIDLMVSVLRALGAQDTASAAKLVETVGAVALFVLACAALGALLFASLFGAGGRGARWAVAAAFAVALGLVALLPQGLPLAGHAAWTLLGASLWAWTLTTVQGRPAPAGSDRGRAEQTGLGRRAVVRLAGASAVLTFVGVALSRQLREPLGGGGAAGEPWSATHPLPNADAAVQPVPGTRPELTPVEDHYRIDINIRPPVIREADWRLRVDGLVQEPRALTLQALRAYPSLDQFITLCCISNPVAGDLIGTTRWSGVSLSRLLEDLRPLPEATHVRLYAADGFDEVLSLAQIREEPRVMLTWAWDGLPLTAEHGFPLRVYVPDRFGMKQPKWIERLELISSWQPGYWVRRGWDREALVKATSVIDVIGPPVEGQGGARVVPVGGIAFAGARGIRRVEVRVDDGPWQPATLRPPLSDKTWVLWRYEWPFEEGEHTVTVRCVDAEGQPQLVESATPHPSGATGLHRREIG